MLTLYVVGAAALYGWMATSASQLPPEMEERTHPEIPFEVVNGHRLLQVVDGGLSATAETPDQKAA